MTPASGKPPARLLATVIRSGSTPGVLHGEHLPGAAEAGLDLVGDQHDAVLVAERAQRLQEFGWRDVEATLPLHGLHDDRRDPRGLDVLGKQPLEAGQRVGDADAVVGDRERRVVDLGRERPEARLVGRRLAGEAHRQQRAAVEARRRS